MLLIAAQPDARKLREGMKDFSNRREGTNIRQDARPDFKLIGIHRTFEQFARNTNLKVGFFLPPLQKDTGSRSVWVEASEVEDTFHYFMQSKDSIRWQDGAWNVFKAWPTKDVIDALGLSSDNIAVVAAYRTGNSRTVFLPVDVTSGDAKPARHSYLFRFVTGQNLLSVDLSLTNSAGSEAKVHKPDLDCKPKMHPGCVLARADTPLIFPLDMTSLTEGEYRLKLAGHMPDGSKTSVEVLLYHHP